jgi:hypothetical protein
MQQEHKRVKKVKTGRLLLCAVTGIMIIVLLSSCGAGSTTTGSWGGGGSSGLCSLGYYRYTTSAGYCCPQGYPYYYNGKCNQCSQGYYKYTTSAGYCCPQGYPYYYNGKCNQCSQGYYKYTTSAGYCCPQGYPYYYNGKCNTRSSGTTTAVNTNVQVDSRTGCPAQKNLQCSQWINAGRCQIQSCTCYYSGRSGDTTAAYYHTSDNAYFRCTGAGQTINCIAAAQAAALHCS